MGQIALKWTGDDSHLFVGRDSRGSTVVAGMWPRAEEEGWVDWRGAKPPTCWWSACAPARPTTSWTS